MDNRLLGPQSHTTADAQHRFIAQLLRLAKHLGVAFRIHRHLHRPGTVPQVNENHTTVVTATVYLATEERVTSW